MQILSEEEGRLLRELRQRLHAHAEFAGEERETINILIEFLTEHTTMALYPKQGWFYAMHHEEAAMTVAVRADMDAISGPYGTAYHGCGHDGHSAILAGLALAVEGRRLGMNLMLIFQPAEETGEGAAMVCQMLQQPIDIIWGFHNIPGYEEGAVLLRPDVFSCASQGLSVTITGKQSHAAYPEDGKNPAFLFSRVVLQLPEWIAQIKKESNHQDGTHSDYIMATVVQLSVGEKNFGISAGQGCLALTLRAQYQKDLDALQQKLLEQVAMECQREQMTFVYANTDRFPETLNHLQVYQYSRQVLLEKGLKVQVLEAPMRWSEDFGWYLKQIPGMYFGIGAGASWPALHTNDYDFNDRLLEVGVEILWTLVSSVQNNPTFSHQTLLPC